MPESLNEEQHILGPNMKPVRYTSSGASLICWLNRKLTAWQISAATEAGKLPSLMIWWIVAVTVRKNK